MSRNAARAIGASTSSMVPKDIAERVARYQSTRTIHRTIADLGVSEHTLAELRTCGRRTEKTIARVVARRDAIDAQAVRT